jgi:hypothetical protein
VSCVVLFTFVDNTCLFRSIETAVIALESTFDPASAKKLIDEFLLVSKNHKEPEKVDIATSFYFDCYCFCGKMAFSSRKTAAFLSIMHDAFVRDSARVFPAWTMAMSYEALQNAIFKHSVQRPPHRYSFIRDEYKCVSFIANVYIILVSRFLRGAMSRGYWISL